MINTRESQKTNKKLANVSSEEFKPLEIQENGPQINPSEVLFNPSIPIPMRASQIDPIIVIGNAYKYKGIHSKKKEKKDKNQWNLKHRFEWNVSIY